MATPPIQHGRMPFPTREGWPADELVRRPTVDDSYADVEQRRGDVDWVAFGLAAAVGFLISWGVYEVLVGLGPSLDCAWVNSYPEGGESVGETIAPLLGVGLLAVGGAASWRRPRLRGLLLVALGVFYVGALVLIWYTLPPEPYHCVWAPSQ